MIFTFRCIIDFIVTWQHTIHVYLDCDAPAFKINLVYFVAIVADETDP